MKRTKQIAGILLSLLLIVGIFPPVQVHASGKVTISVSASSVNIGESVTITARASGPNGEEAIAKLGFNYDSGKFSFVSCSESTYSGGGGGYVGVVSSTASITLKATASGSASVSVSGSDGVNINDETAEYGELSAGGTTLNVNNKATGNTGSTGNTGNTDGQNTENTSKSGDNSLSSLNISPGTLSPAFKYNTTSYTASVGADVTSIAVDAKPSNANATVESVTGNTDLKEGANTISIVVKAENGTTATYKIVVTRGGGGAAEEEQEEEQDKPEENGENAEGITVNGHPFNLAPAIPADIVPQDFTKTTVNVKGQQVEGLQFEKGTLTLVYLTTPDKEVKNTLAVYEEASGSFYQFRKIQLGETNYLILLNPPAETGLSQEYTQTTQSMGGYENVPAFVKAADASAAQQGLEGTEAESEGEEAQADTAEGEGAEDGAEGNAAAGGIEFSLVYAISSFGNTGWYQYDVLEETFQRYVPVAAASQETVADTETQEEPSVEMQGLQNAYKDLEAQYNKKKEVSRKTTAVLIFLIAVLVVVVVNLLLRGRRSEEEESFYEEPKPRARKRSRMEEDAFREENQPGVRKRSRMEEDAFREENQPGARRRAQMEADLRKDSWGEETAPKRTLSQETRPMYKQEKKPEEGRPSAGAVSQPGPSAGAASQSRPSVPREPKDDFEVIDLEDL